MSKLQKTKSGFTIIEVVLVLAIAGLIFLMVFLALPNLQRSQRDTQRRDDLARFQTAITNYQTNNRGKLPGTNKLATEAAYVEAYNNFVNNYLRVGGDEFTDPDGQPYYVAQVCPDFGSPGTYANYCKDKSTDSAYQEFNSTENTSEVKASDVGSSDSGNVKAHNIFVYQNAACDGEAVVASTGTRKIAIQFKMEGGGWYCGNN
ncbi:type II secretion system protein [Candidatus Saccharibacteria bacterium]|nr:type II secretion system protein [Candidatus Saccharibacteria bacterium]